MKNFLLTAGIFVAFALAGTACTSRNSPPQDPLLGVWIASSQNAAIPPGASVTILLGTENSYVESRRDARGNVEKNFGVFARSRRSLAFGEKKYSYALERGNAPGAETLTLSDELGNVLIFRRAEADLTPLEQPLAK